MGVEAKREGAKVEAKGRDGGAKGAEGKRVQKEQE